VTILATSSDDATPPSSGALRPFLRAPLYLAIAERVLSHVVQSRLVPGERLPSERELARRLGVSRSSVRQAITVLVSQGVLEVRHGGGTFLVELDATREPLASIVRRRGRLPEVHETREVLEVPIAALAARRRTDADIEAIDRALALMSAEIAAGEVGNRGDGAFHAAVTAAAHNPVLAGLMSDLAASIAETRSESLAQSGRPPRSLADHESIADAIRRGDEAGAAEAMRAHLASVADIALLRWDPDDASVPADGPAPQARA